jgi:type VI secretion system protein ImpA
LEFSVSSIDLDDLLKPLSAEAPCGVDASYDADYLALERLVQGTPEQQVGDHVIPASDPDWRKIKDLGLGLFSKTKDLRVALPLTLALLNLEALPGFRDGMALLRGLIERYWDTVFPQLDPDEANPALERVNVISALSPREEGYADPMRFRRRLTETPLTQSARMGRFSLRDMLIAEGELKPAATEDGKARPDRATVAAALADSPREHLSLVQQALAESCEHLDAIAGVFNDKAGSGYGVDLSATRACLKQMLERVSGATPEVAATRSAETGTTPIVATAAPAAPATPAGSVPGAVASQQDILQALDSICQYYEKNEPSSPVPVLLGRARRLVGKSYVEIAKDLTPDAIKQIEALGGKKV